MQEHRVCKLEDLKEGHGSPFQVGEEHIALFRVGDQVFAIQELCPHRGAPLSEGALIEYEVRCPWHDAKFDIRTGEVRSLPARRNLKKFQVRIEAGEVFVRDIE